MTLLSDCLHIQPNVGCILLVECWLVVQQMHSNLWNCCNSISDPFCGEQWQNYLQTLHYLFIITKLKCSMHVLFEIELLKQHRFPREFMFNFLQSNLIRNMNFQQSNRTRCGKHLRVNKGIQWCLFSCSIAQKQRPLSVIT